jgi:hypothetical protein
MGLSAHRNNAGLPCCSAASPQSTPACAHHCSAPLPPDPRTSHWNVFYGHSKYRGGYSLTRKAAAEAFVTPLSDPNKPHWERDQLMPNVPSVLLDRSFSSCAQSSDQNCWTVGRLQNAVLLCKDAMCRLSLRAWSLEVVSPAPTPQRSKLITYLVVGGVFWCFAVELRADCSAGVEIGREKSARQVVISGGDGERWVGVKIRGW